MTAGGQIPIGFSLSRSREREKSKHMPQWIALLEKAFLGARMPVKKHSLENRVLHLREYLDPNIRCLPAYYIRPLQDHSFIETHLHFEGVPDYS